MGAPKKSAGCANMCHVGRHSSAIGKMQGALRAVELARGLLVQVRGLLVNFNLATRLLLGAVDKFSFERQ
jgi:hypothetical protein